MSRDDTDGKGGTFVNRRRSEIKAPSSRNAIQSRLKKAHKQEVEVVYMDVRGTGLTQDVVRNTVRGQVSHFASGASFSSIYALIGPDTYFLPFTRLRKVYGD